jgi:hypothetical protein
MSVKIYKKNNTFVIKSSRIGFRKTLDIIDHPVDTTIYINDNSSSNLTLLVTTAPNLNINWYLWQVSTNNGISYNNIIDSNSSSITINNINLEDSGNKYRCIINFNQLTVISLTARLTVEYSYNYTLSLASFIP